MKRTKWMVLPMLFMLIVVGSNMKVLASTRMWNLRYIKGAPSSECVTSKNFRFESEGAFVTCYVDSVTNGAKVRFLYEGKYYEDFTGPGFTKQFIAPSGFEVEAKVSFIGHGYMKQTSYAKGKVIN